MLKIMKKLLRKLKHERIINNFLSILILDELDFDDYDTCVMYDYTYNGESMMYINVEEYQMFVYIDDILKLLNLEYNRYILERITKFINKPDYNILVYCELFYDPIGIEEYERIVGWD